MKFGIEKYVMVILKKWKIETNRGMELPNQESIRTLGEKNSNEMKGKVKKKKKKEYLRRMSKLFQTKLCSKILIKRINICAVLLVRYSGLFLKWTYIKAKIENTQQNTKCKLYDDKDETVNRIISKYGKLTQKEYITRPDWVGKVIHRELCKRL